MMAGWFAVITLSALVFAMLLFVTKNRKAIWTVIAAPIVLALAGYAMQGRPTVPSASAKALPKGGQEIETFIFWIETVFDPIGQFCSRSQFSDGGGYSAIGD
jgi:cytochrome c-type biogenesis protein CcmH